MQLRKLNNLPKTRASGISLPTALLAVVAGVCFLTPAAQADTLRDVLSSGELRRMTDQTDAMNRRSNRGRSNEQNFLIGIDPNSEFARVWQTARAPELLLNWLGVNLPNYALSGTDSYRSRELVQAKTILKNRERQRVTLEVLVPHPTYHTMVHFKTLKALNVFEPPTLETVAEEQLNFRQVTGMYYRTTGGQCSILIKVARLGIVNLSVQSCEQSHMMTDIINLLDFERLNKKLNS